jgi:DNA replication protein DnaC
MTRPTTELAHLFRALKAPAAARALPKLADRAREEEWSYEQFAATLLKTEIDSRDSHGGQGRIKAARFPARKTIEDFDFAFQTSLRRDQVLHLAQLDFLAGKENIVLLGPPGTGKTHLSIALGIGRASPATASRFEPRPNGSPSWPTPSALGASTTSSHACNASRC